MPTAKTSNLCDKSRHDQWDETRSSRPPVVFTARKTWEVITNAQTRTETQIMLVGVRMSMRCWVMRYAKTNSVKEEEEESPHAMKGGTSVDLTCGGGKDSKEGRKTTTRIRRTRRRRRRVKRRKVRRRGGSARAGRKESRVSSPAYQHC